MFDNFNIYEWLFDIPGRRNIRKAEKRKKAEQAESEELKNKYKHSPFFHELLNFIDKKDKSYVLWHINFRQGGKMIVQWIKIDSEGYIERMDKRFTEYPDLTDTLVYADIGYEYPQHISELCLAFQEVLGDNYECSADENGYKYDGVTLKVYPPEKPSGLKPTL